MPKVTPKAVQLVMFGAQPLTEAQLGQALRDQAKRKLVTENQEWLTRARNAMVAVIREKGACSSDDCWAVCPPPADAHPSLMGCLFDDPRFLRTSAIQSGRASARKRWISVYELKDEL